MLECILIVCDLVPVEPRLIFAFQILPFFKWGAGNLVLRGRVRDGHVVFL